jgi:large subunit ribosomal protein L6
MSKLAKKPILIPKEVNVTLQGKDIIVKGPKGQLTRTLPEGFSVKIEGDSIFLIPPPEQKKDTKALTGTYYRHISNMIQGVTQGFEKNLEFEGIGYRAEVSGKELILNVGFSHPVKLNIPEGITVSVGKNIISIKGYDKEAVGQFAAIVRAVRPPEPYKGTGIRYQGEIIRRKAGKKLAGQAGG